MHSHRWIFSLLMPLCAACTATSERADGPDAAVAAAAQTEANAVSARAPHDSAAQLARLRSLRSTDDDLAARDTSDLRVEVDIRARRVRVLDDASGDTIAQHAIAVGSAEWPTRTGQWTIGQVVLNPEWIPPTEESWAKDADTSASGDPANPLGVAQLVYDLPRSIHGTNDPSSIGKAVSHGSIRATNEAVIALATLLMEHTQVEGTAEIVERARRERTVKQIVNLPQLVPIRVY
jgi:lipoprotein-anchoring transpeptidase ErfK/SrfK